jgi:hypothetical protein
VLERCTAQFLRHRLKYQPGTIALTWMPSGASSTALTLVNPIIPASPPYRPPASPC